MCIFAIKRQTIYGARTISLTARPKLLLQRPGYRPRRTHPRSRRGQRAKEGGTRIVFMDGGVVVEYGPPEQVLDHPQHERTKKFLNMIKVHDDDSAAKKDPFEKEVFKIRSERKLTRKK